MAIDYNCLASKRRDVHVFFTSNGWDPANLAAIYSGWWNLDRRAVPQVPPDSNSPPPPGYDDSASFYTLLDYAMFKGCVNAMPTGPAPPITVPPNTSPGSGGHVPPPGSGAIKSVPPGSQVTQALTWAKQNPLAIAGGAALLFLIFYRPAPFQFDR